MLRTLEPASMQAETSPLDLMKWIDYLKELALGYGPNFLGALLTLLFGRIGARLAKSILARIMERVKLERMLISFSTNLAYMALLAFVVVSALDTLGLETGSFVAIIGAAGLAVGFALQGSLSNIASGVLIIIFRPYRIGDFIEAGGQAGVVEDIQVFSTITNYSANPIRRIDLVFGIDDEEDIDRARTLLEKIKKTFDSKGISIPYPQTDMHLHEVGNNPA